MARKKQRRSLPCFTFTPEMVVLIQAAMKLFAQALAEVAGPLTKVALARETMQQINHKLETLSIAEESAYPIPFDYNEKVVIATAIQVYMLHLASVPASSQQAKELQYCRYILQVAQNNQPGEGREQKQCLD